MYIYKGKLGQTLKRTYVHCGRNKRYGILYAQFWEKYPTSLYADGLCTDNASLTAWIVPPDAEAQDMRHYDTVAHDQTYYEGFPEIGSSAYGIANTNEMSLFLMIQCRRTMNL